MKRRLFYVVLGLAATTVLLSAPAASADGLPPLTLSKTALKPGDTITVSGSGCLPNDETDQVRVLVSLSDIESATPAPDGTWSATASVPATTLGGHLSFRVHASCGHTPSGWTDYPDAPITVDAPPAVSLTAPTAGAAFSAPASIPVAASVSDDLGTITIITKHARARRKAHVQLRSRVSLCAICGLRYSF